MLLMMIYNNKIIVEMIKLMIMIIIRIIVFWKSGKQQRYEKGDFPLHGSQVSFHWHLFFVFSENFLVFIRNSLLLHYIAFVCTSWGDNIVFYLFYAFNLRLAKQRTGHG